MERILEPYELAEQYDNELEKRKLENAKKCDWCGDEITDTYYSISGEDVCEYCIEKKRKTLF